MCSYPPLLEKLQNFVRLSLTVLILSKGLDLTSYCLLFFFFLLLQWPLVFSSLTVFGHLIVVNENSHFRLCISAVRVLIGGVAGFFLT